MKSCLDKNSAKLVGVEVVGRDESRDGTDAMARWLFNETDAEDFITG